MPEATTLPNPVIPAGSDFEFTLPDAPSITNTSSGGSGDRDTQLSNLFGRKTEEATKPAAEEKREEAPEPSKAPEVKPPAEEKPAPPAKPAEPAPKPNEEKKPADGPKPPETAQKPPEGQELPENMLDGIPENQPANHREAAKAFTTMRKRIAAADTRIKELSEKAKKTVSAPPPDYEEAKTTAARLQSELEARETALRETQDRLYARDLRERPEYQQHVDEPWKEVQATVQAVCKRSGQNADDVWQALRLPDADARDTVLAEMMGTMSALDQGDFRDAIRSIPQINKAKRILEAQSKEQLDAFRAQDEAKERGQREQETKRALAAHADHREKRKAQVPFLFHAEGDSEDVKTYNAGLQDVITRAEGMVKAGGLSKLPPELQSMMVFDAMTASHVLNGVGAILRGKEAKIKELEAKHAETEAALKTAESELAEYRSAGPGDGGATPSADGATKEGAGLGERLGRVAPAFGWK